MEFDITQLQLLRGLLYAEKLNCERGNTAEEWTKHVDGTLKIVDDLEDEIVTPTNYIQESYE